VRDEAADPGTPNRIFFGSVAKNFTREAYRGALRDLSSNADQLISDLADQIHNNSKIADTKTRSVKWAIRAALAAIVLVAALAVVVGLLPATPPPTTP
jgi:hypothetical protein